jgi:transposase
VQKLIFENTRLKDKIIELEFKFAALEKDKNAQIEELSVTIEILIEQLKLARAQAYACSAERFVPQVLKDQDFDEEATPEEKVQEKAEIRAEEAFDQNEALDDLIDDKLQEVALGETQAETQAETQNLPQSPLPAPKKKTGPKKDFPSYLPRVYKYYTLTPEELLTTEGFRFTKIGEVRAQEVIFIPEQVMVVINVREQYACKGREELGIKTAPAPERIFSGGYASSSLVAHVLTQKYLYHIPLYRQEEAFKQLEIPIRRASMCSWVMKAGEIFQPLVDVLKETIQATSYIHADETPVTVLTHALKGQKKKDHSIEEKESTPKQSAQGYMWIYGNSLENLIYYEYQENRNGEHARDFFKDFKGHLQADAYSGYDQVYENPHITEVGCMAHARRKFNDVLKVTKGHTHAKKAMTLIGKLYALEDMIRTKNKEEELGFDQIYKLRQEIAKPILNQLKTWMDDISPKTLPSSLFGKALAYAKNHWEALIEYANHGHLDIDNNFAENAIRPFALGRKNWLFNGNHDGARAGANIYTLIQNAKNHNLNVQAYLIHVFDNIKQAQTKEALSALLPHRIKRADHPKLFLSTPDP